MFCTWGLPVNEVTSTRNGGCKGFFHMCLAELPFQSAWPGFSSFSFLSPINVCTGSNSGSENQWLKHTWGKLSLFFSLLQCGICASTLCRHDPRDCRDPLGPPHQAHHRATSSITSDQVIELICFTLAPWAPPALILQGQSSRGLQPQDPRSRGHGVKIKRSLGIQRSGVKRSLYRGLAGQRSQGPKGQR